MTRNLYAVLGVDAQASPAQIQAAYIHWAKKLSTENEASNPQSLKELQQAYAVLANPPKRREYDARHANTGQLSEAEPMRDPLLQARGSTGGGESIPEYSLRESFDSVHPSFDELFERLWSNYSEVTRPKAERLEGLTIEVPITARHAQQGGYARILVPARASCPACGGHGALGIYQCWQCQGQGAITADYPVEISYPAGTTHEHVVQVPLDHLGIKNFFLTVRFRVTGAGAESADLKEGV